MENQGKREYKSSVFTMLLQDKSNALEVFNALNNTTYTEEQGLSIKMLESAVYLSFRNDASFIIADTLNLYEHQSTYNPNMPLRSLIYVSSIYAELVKEENLYGRKRIPLPLPRFVTFYNGMEERPETEIQRLSDAFVVKEEHPELELICTVINMNPGYNEEFMSNCGVLREYMIFVEKTRYYQNGMGLPLTEAIEKAIDECIKEHVLEEFLKKQKAEVISMSVLDFDLERQLGFARKEGMEEGEERGSDLKLISQICRKLKKNKEPAMIAEELEEDFEIVEHICEVAAKFAPEYDIEKIYEALNGWVA